MFSTCRAQRTRSASTSPTTRTRPAGPSETADMRLTVRTVPFAKPFCWDVRCDENARIRPTSHGFTGEGLS
jgi:hypothetical protein